VKSELGKLIELQKSDLKIRDLKETIETADKRRADIQQEFEKHASSIREVQGREKDLKARRAELEKQVAESGTMLERSERNLKVAQSQRDYELAMREIDTLQKQVQTAETEILEVDEKLEGVGKELADRAEEINSFEEKRSAALAEFDAAVEQAKVGLEAERKVRAELFSKLPPELAAVYDDISRRSDDGEALADATEGACGACSMTLRPHLQMEVKTGVAIITCESCARILYLAD
jgi:predicted  nucleic acid-binding Zn-ribbon protein